VDLFGEETEEEKKAAEERAATIKASSKKKECKFLCLRRKICFGVFLSKILSRSRLFISCLFKPPT